MGILCAKFELSVLTSDLSWQCRFVGVSLWTTDCAMDSRSLATQFDLNSGAPCGYCHQGNSSHSYGMYAHILTVDDYQDLIDRGWRRSGIYCYKPIMDRTCCPAYTIRCDVKNFNMTKSQKKIMKKFNKYLIDGEAPECIAEEQIDETSTKKFESNRDQIAKKSNPSITKGVGFDPSKGSCKKAKQIRLEKREEKLKAKCIDPQAVVKNVPKTQAKTLEDIINELPENTKKKLKIKLVKSSTQTLEWKSTETITHNLYAKYQMVIHNDPPDKCTKRQFERFLVKSPLQIKTIKCGGEEFISASKSSAKLFEKYQMSVHNEKPDECDIVAYVDFLVKTPLLPVTRDNVDYGSFHQQYWLDDDLIAVGVIDILPKCISSVYFFYDPDLMNLTLGTFGALSEISFARQLNVRCDGIKYYYMGFYIHTCVKMRYKGNYQPSYLLCPETYQWFPIKDALTTLNGKLYSRLNPNANDVDSNQFRHGDINMILIFDGRSSRIMTYEDYKKTLRPRISPSSRVDESLLKIYGKLTGQKLSGQIVLLV